MVEVLRLNKAINSHWKLGAKRCLFSPTWRTILCNYNVPIPAVINAVQSKPINKNGGKKV